MAALNLTRRHRQPELMDQPGLDEQTHRKALTGIGRVNNLSRIRHVLGREIIRIARHQKLKRVRVLDLACGGGDLAIGLGRHASRHNIGFKIDGCDISPVAIAHANDKALASKVNDVRFFECDVLNDSFNESVKDDYDIVMCSLFLHHLEENQAIQLLQKMASKAQHAVIVNDLRRTQLGYGLAWIGCRLLTRSSMVHVDGPLSVEGAFTIEETKMLAWEAGLQNVRMVKHWPERFLMTWQRTEA